jgi:signal transduction histidine kinase
MSLHEPSELGHGGFDTLATAIDVDQRQVVLGEIASVLVHEIRQPLTAIATNGEACLRWLEREDIDRVKLHSVVGEIIKLAYLASETADRIKHTFAGDSLPFGIIDFRAVLDEATGIVRSECDDERIKLISELGIGKVFILGDHIQLRQVFLNLLANAVEALRCASAATKVITVDIQIDQSSLTASVSDTGPGIDSNISHRIFESLFSTKASNMGMGLSISRTIVQSHGGRLEASNPARGGARFAVSLPRVLVTDAA